MVHCQPEEETGRGEDSGYYKAADGFVCHLKSSQEWSETVGYINRKVFQLHWSQKVGRHTSRRCIVPINPNVVNLRVRAVGGKNGFDEEDYERKTEEALPKSIYDCLPAHVVWEDSNRRRWWWRWWRWWRRCANLNAHPDLKTFS